MFIVIMISVMFMFMIMFMFSVMFMFSIMVDVRLATANRERTLPWHSPPA